MREHQLASDPVANPYVPQASRDAEASRLGLTGEFDPLAGVSGSRAESSDVEVHARALNRVTGSQPSRAVHSLLRLQRRYGNRYVQRALALARQADGEGEVTPEVESAIDGARGGGQGLDHGVRGQMESAFGADFGGVRIHTGAQAHSLNRAVSAIAFTTGQDIFFRDGAYSPGSSEGKQLLAHELTHVVQQGGATPISGKAERIPIQRMCPACEEEKRGVQTKLVVGPPGDQYEQEADRVAERVMSMPEPLALGEAGVASSPTNVPLQRQDDDDQGNGSTSNGSTEVAVDQDMPAPDDEGEQNVSAPAPVALIHSAPVLQRWHSDGPASGSTNTIVCDGKGGVRTQLGGTGDAKQTGCLSDCIRQHEESHRADALGANPKVCDGQSDGTQVTFNGEQKASEIKASNVEIGCLQAKLPTAGDCKDTITARITQITAYRDSFK